MSVVAKGGTKAFTPPPVGIHPALCVDVIDLGEVETPFKDPRTGKTKSAYQIQVVWQLHAEDDGGKLVTRDDGKPHRISKFYTLSLNLKSNLRKDLESWRGQPFTDAELEDGFDVEKLIGVQCQLNLIAKQDKQKRDIVVVQGVMPKHRRDPKIAVDPTFVRECEVPGGRDQRSPAKDESEPNGQASGGPDLLDEDSDNLPF